MKYIIIEGGIFALSIANLLNKENEAIVLEADSVSRGMINITIN